MAPRIPFESLSSAERGRLLADDDRLRQQLLEVRRLSDLAGNSRAIRQVRDLIAQVAPSAETVWLRGEEGVGKTRAARAIHLASPRFDRPFMILCCAAMPEAVVDAQLFGTADGISMGGGVGRAAGGTLFFDEIADLGPLGQKRLLLLAREHAWTRADGARIPADVRLIAATSRNIDLLASSGTFRRDLLDALSAQTIHLPPLRERRGDVPVLSNLFVDQFSREQVRLVRRVSGRALDMLMNYGWPGNVSELQRTIERAVILTTGPVIHHHHLPSEIQAAGGSQPASMLGLSEALDAFEKELLQDALGRARGVRSQAARLLMTSERVLSYRLRKHGIDSRRFKG